MQTIIPDTEEYRDSIATVDKAGKRIWVYPRKPHGHLHDMRVVTAIVLLIGLLGTPFIKTNGNPFLLFNIFERKFIIFGQPFFPQDFHIFVLATITFFVFIILFTVVFGRVWCGWACPQTIFMEMVFRKIEYWIEGDANRQRALDQAPWDTDKILKRIAKHAIFITISFIIAHTVMAYLVGVDQTWDIIRQAPTAHWSGFVGLLAFTGIFYFVFTRLREQVCISICPYGRLQGVLLVKESIIVAYDYLRGEPRTKIQKKKTTAEEPKKPCTSCNSCGSGKGVCDSADTEAKTLAANDFFFKNLEKEGDCIDCKLCIQVCPTGIDIRNGTQLECVNCTACIDACDQVMEKIGKPKGLIRFDSAKGIEAKTKLRLTPRIVAYSVVLLALIGLQAFLLSNRSDIETTVLRVPGMLYQTQPNGDISNLYNVQFVNKTFDAIPVTLQVQGGQGKIRVVGNAINLPAGGTTEAVVFVDLPRSAIHQAKTKLVIEVLVGNEIVERAKTNFLGPVE